METADGKAAIIMPSLDDAFMRGSETAVIRELLTFDHPSDELLRWRWNVLAAALAKHHPDQEQSGFVE